MRRFIIILLLFIPIFCSASNYYVKTGGNDLAAGTSDGTAWESITKVNATSFVAGDSIFFNRGDRFVGTLTPKTSGTLTSYITFGAYGTGDNPIITPNAVIPGLVWTTYGSDGIYQTTGITYNPGNLLIDGTEKINKINDYHMTHPSTSGYYGDFTPLQLLALSETYQFTIERHTFYFWDGLDALYCYDASTGTTYIRFRDGDNPNDYTFTISAENSKAVYVYKQRYINIQNLHIIGAEWGVAIFNIYYVGADNVIVENCTIESSNRKVYIAGGSTDGCYGVTIRNNTMTNNYLSPYNPGAWDNGTEYKHNVYYHYYRFFKNRVGTGDSAEADQGIYLTGIAAALGDILIYGNTILYCVNGITAGPTDSKIYDNYIEGTSSVGIMMPQGNSGAEVHDNYIVNSNIPFRFASVDDATPRTNYIYKNRIYNPEAGVLMYLHYAAASGVSTMTVYLYHNSFIGKYGVDCSGYIDDNASPSGFIFINNIFSTEKTNFTGTVGIYSKANCFVFYNNWLSGAFYGGAGTPSWASDASNIIYIAGPTFWNHSIDPPDFTDLVGLGSGNVINAGIDVSAPFVLGGVNYSALPGTDAGDYWDDPDMGWYEYTGDDPLTITTTKPYWTSLTTAMGGGNVFTEGTGTVTARGVCWNTTGTPTVSDDKTTDGGGAGVFASTMVGLKFGTTYYVRAYATNEHGTGYGGQYTFRQQLTKHNSKIIKHLGKFIIID